MNKNPEGENAVKEVQKEILRLDPEAKVLTDLQIAMVMKQINTRVRFKGWAAQEILLKLKLAEKLITSASNPTPFPSNLHRAISFMSKQI